MRFVSHYVAGDHTMVTRIAAMSDTGANATAGLMIRESHAGGSPCVAVHRTGAGAVVMCWRTTEGGVMQSMTATGAGPASTWLRLARVGSTFTAAFSDNNVSWTTIASCSPTITLSPVLSGMAVSSSTKGVLNTVSFVGAEGPTVPAITSQPQSVTVAVSQTATFMITATGGPTPRYQWQRNGSDLAGAIAASYTTSATIAADSGATFRCLTINNMGSALSSPAILTVTQPPVGAVTSIRFYPRAGKEVRMVGGIFEGSNGTVDSGPFVTLATMNLIPAAGAWTSITSDKQVTAYRFLRYRSPVGSYGNVAEIAFLNNGTKLPGVGFGTSGSWNNSGNDWTKALDGDVISFLDCNQPDGAYVGIDTGTAPSITTHPANVTMADGQTATFAVAASGIPEPTYQWSSAPAVSTTFTAISGATSASYTTGMISNAMSGTKYRCEATNSVGSATSTAATLTVLVWRTNDIGAVAAAGSSVLSGGIWTLTGSGNDIWGTSDEFRFTSQPTRGDVVITAQVTGLQNTNAWAKAGVMVREMTGATSRHAFTCLTASNGAAFQRRRTTGGASVHTGGPAQLLAPGWVRLERVGNLFISSVSSTGTTWTEIRRETIVMDLAVHVGLAVTSHADGTLCTATFSNVTVVSVPVAMN